MGICNTVTPRWIHDQKSKPKVNSRDCHQINVWSISVLISVTITYIWTKFYIELKHYTTNMSECSKFTWLRNPRWWRPPSWISENVNNSELDRAICTKFGGQMHHGHAEMTHDQNSKPELFCVTSLWWIKMYILNECREYNRCDDVKAYKSCQLIQIFSLSLCSTHLFALLSRLLICHTPATNKLY